MAKYYSSATFAILLLVAAAMTAPQIAFSHLTGDSLFSCWEAVYSLEGCLTKTAAPGVLNVQLRLTPLCCHAVRQVGEYCLSAIYPSFSFDPKLGDLLQGICAENVDAAPQPAAA